MIDYRDATPADGAALDAMAQAIWIETFAHGVSAEDAATYLAEAYGPNGKLLADLSSGAARFHLALVDGRVVGYAKVNPPWLPDAEPSALQLSQIYVSSDQHGAGVGKALLDWAIATARAEGATTATGRHAIMAKTNGSGVGRFRMRGSTSRKESTGTVDATNVRSRCQIL
jgi:GNAT superfamily N-acetyltransferase